jgi:hypothetical protein
VPPGRLGEHDPWGPDGDDDHQHGSEDDRGDECGASTCPTRPAHGPILGGQSSGSDGTGRTTRAGDLRGGHRPWSSACGYRISRRSAVRG